MRGGRAGQGGVLRMSGCMHDALALCLTVRYNCWPHTLLGLVRAPSRSPPLAMKQSRNLDMDKSMGGAPAGGACAGGASAVPAALRAWPRPATPGVCCAALCCAGCQTTSCCWRAAGAVACCWNGPSAAAPLPSAACMPWPMKPRLPGPAMAAPPMVAPPTSRLQCVSRSVVSKSKGVHAGIAGGACPGAAIVVNRCGS